MLRSKIIKPKSNFLVDVSRLFWKKWNVFLNEYLKNIRNRIILAGDFSIDFAKTMNLDQEV